MKKRIIAILVTMLYLLYFETATCENSPETFTSGGYEYTLTDEGTVCMRKSTK